MAYLNLADDKTSNCFKFIGTEIQQSKPTHLISNTVSLLAPSSSEYCEDTCSFYSGPSDATIFAFGESSESCGSIAYNGESCGSIAYTGSGESCGSIASTTSYSSGSSFSGGGCSYSC